jgi:hypothetical protein
MQVSNRRFGRLSPTSFRQCTHVNKIRGPEWLSLIFVCLRLVRGGGDRLILGLSTRDML